MKTNLRERLTRYQCVITPKVHFAPELGFKFRCRVSYISSYWQFELEGKQEYVPRGKKNILGGLPWWLVHNYPVRKHQWKT